VDADLSVKLAVYGHFAETGRAPEPEDVAKRTGIAVPDVLESYRSLRSQKLMLLEPDGRSIRIAPPFSGVPTQHIVEAGGLSFYANCAWDALGIVAALQTPARVRSRCEQSMEPLDLAVGLDGPPSSTWLFHCLVPAARWWDDLVFT